MLHLGGCHCGQVSFEFESEPTVLLHRCNCSICRLMGFEHLIIPSVAFNLLTNWDRLSVYEFNSCVAKHYFCHRCGVKSFYIPRSNPDGVSVNFRCVDQQYFTQVKFEDFDGENWEAHADKLAVLSRPR